MKRSTLGIGLVSAIVLLSVLVIFQNTYGQADYVINTDRGSDTITETSSEPEGPQVWSTCNVCGEITTWQLYRTWHHLIRITWFDQEWYYAGWINVWTIEAEISKWKGGTTIGVSPCNCGLASGGG